jgi:hypothetical protein
MAHMDKNSNFQIPVIESLSFVKILTYQKDLWDISANVKSTQYKKLAPMLCGIEFEILVFSFLPIDLAF